jgi:hypothetical protein
VEISPIEIGEADSRRERNERWIAAGVLALSLVSV